MPESRRPESWSRIGLLLPRSLRELMYEPLCDDIWRAHVTATARAGRVGLWIRFLGCFAAAVGYSLPRYFVERNRVTAIGKVTLVVASGFTLIAVVTLLPWIVFLATHS